MIVGETVTGTTNNIKRISLSTFLTQTNKNPAFWQYFPGKNHPLDSTKGQPPDTTIPRWTSSSRVASFRTSSLLGRKQSYPWENLAYHSPAIQRIMKWNNKNFGHDFFVCKEWVGKKHLKNENLPPTVNHQSRPPVLLQLIQRCILALQNFWRSPQKNQMFFQSWTAQTFGYIHGWPSGQSIDNNHHVSTLVGI